jgi:hypothetical protein
MFRAYCASCQGADWKGHGPAAQAPEKQPSDLTWLTRQSGGKFQAMRVTRSIRDGALAVNGPKDMPVWGLTLSSVSLDNPKIVDQRVSNLVGSIESMQVK